MAAQQTDLRHTPPWLFFFLLMPSSIGAGFCLVFLPYVLSTSGVSVETTSAMLALTILPQSLRLLWTPLLDLGVRRRSAHVFTSLASLCGLLGAVAALERHELGLLSVVLVAMNIAMTTSDVALGYLCATSVDPKQKERAASYYSAGAVCLAGLWGGIMLTLREPFGVLVQLVAPLSLGQIGAASAVVMFGFTLLALKIDEPLPARLPVARHVRTLLANTWSGLRTKHAWTGLLICVSPLCSGAAANLFGTLAADFHASAGHVTIATGPSAAVASAFGALLGGRLAARVGGRAAHLYAGLALALVAVTMAVGPRRPDFYVAGCLGYAVFCGMAYGTFFSFVFELVGLSIGATTQYGLYTCAGNLALTYVTFIDGQMYRYGGRFGLLAFDAAANLTGILLVMAIHYLADARLQPGSVQNQAS